MSRKTNLLIAHFSNIQKEPMPLHLASSILSMAVASETRRSVSSSLSIAALSLSTCASSACVYTTASAYAFASAAAERRAELEDRMTVRENERTLPDTPFAALQGDRSPRLQRLQNLHTARRNIQANKNLECKQAHEKFPKENWRCKVVGGRARM